MRYKFPTIYSIKDVLPHIEGCDNIKVYNREHYDVINYVMMDKETFPDIDTSTDYLTSAIRRECRGLIFDKNGMLRRRAFHKFFNVGERPEVMPSNISFDVPYKILDKLDGSMVTPLSILGDHRFATKAGYTDTSALADRFVADNSNQIPYVPFCKELDIDSWLPIFEFMSRKNRVIIDHPQDKMVLLAVRHRYTGRYMMYDEMKEIADSYEIPIVQHVADSSTIDEFVEKTRKSEQQVEGYVIRFNDGHSIKIKTEWYVNVHVMKESISQEKHVIRATLDEAIDDILPFLLEDDKERLLNFVGQFNRGIEFTVRVLANVLATCGQTKEERKEFAINVAPTMDKALVSTIFKCWDTDRSLETIRDAVINQVMKCLGSQTDVDKARKLWGGVVWNYTETE